MRFHIQKDKDSSTNSRNVRALKKRSYISEQKHMTKEKDPKDITEQDLDDVAGGRGGGSPGGVGDDDMKSISGGRGSLTGGGTGGGGGTSGVGDDDLKSISAGKGGSDIKVKIQDADLEG